MQQIGLTQFQVLMKKFEESERNNTTKINELLKKIEELESQEVKLDSGMVVAFNRESCPTGWTSLTTLFKDTEGAFIRNLGGQAKNIGAVQLDAVPNITGTFGSLRDWGYTTYSGVFQKGASKNSYNGIDVVSGYMINFDASTSSKSYGRDDTTEVRPKNIALLYCVKR